jgi:putative tryptophan/tyrosine transport system ATP-binding protein
MLELRQVTVTLGKGTRLAHPVLKDLNLSVKKGEFVVVVGENGAGKSTLLNVISGFLKPCSGRIFLEGREITFIPQNKKAALISKVVQDPKMGTMENMSILENMTFSFRRGQSRRFSLFSNAARKAFFREKLSMLQMGLEERLDERVGNLSGGQRQALSLVMAILAEAKVLLLDEMTAALDPKASEKVMCLADKLVRKEKRTCLMITHNMTHARQYGDRLLKLEDGRL